jgi:hypothetical protein
MPNRTSLISRFEASISQVDELLAIHYYLQSAPVTQVTDNILRASLTMMVSAIDTSVHELIISAIMFELKEDKSVFNLENVKIGALALIESDEDTRIRLIESDLRRQFSKESFQSSRQIESSLAQIGITKIWKKLASTLGQSPEDIKVKLDLLVRRRNQIVHEGDLDHLHSIREIGREDLYDSLAFTKNLVAGIINEYTNLIDV